MLRLRNKIQFYAWGSRRSLAEFLGAEVPAREPQAELWMGAHPSAPSEVFKDNSWLSLTRWIELEPEHVLGKHVLATFGPRLPFLFKVLAAETPLSIQAHPSAEQAELGFRAEEERGIALCAPERIYKDFSHKPELLCALTDFDALCGFRPAEGTLTLLRALELPALSEYVTTLARATNSAGIRTLLSALLSATPSEQRALVERTAEAAERLRARGSEFDAELEWLSELAHIYPGDIGVVSALLLNLVRLAPGEAIYLPAGNLHAYLRGMGVELMANSDNVIRGGLTSKHVDVPELLRILSFDAEAGAGVQRVMHGNETCYVTAAREFELTRLNVTTTPSSVTHHRLGLGPEIVLCSAGNVTLSSNEVTLELARGESAFVCANDPPYAISGSGTVFRATVPSSSS